MTDTIVWITGATAGLGSGLARTVPYRDARVINLSRSVHPDLETVKFDLTDPTTYPSVQNHVESTLRNFAGERVIFIHNAYYPAVPGFVSEVDGEEYRRAVQANAAAPMILGDMFLRAVQDRYESGLVMMSSAGARHPFEGLAHYCAAKAATEMWVRVVRRELKRRGRRTWVAAVRPGFVDTPTTRMNALQPAESYPVGPQISQRLAKRADVLSPEQAGRDIWAKLTPVPPDTSVLLFGEMVPDQPPA
jgi:NAD(P)-dependent dehydrogenase (short-subunit alcohol dehydrogenase family)